MRTRYLSTGFLALAPKAFGVEFEISSSAPKAFEEVGSVAVVHVCGPLEQHPHRCWLDYETLRAQAQAAFDCPTAKAVALCVNSPGGAAAGCFELSRALREMSERAGKPLGVFVDGMAASAAYAIACAATPGLLYAPQTSTVGSLAVYEMMIDQSSQDNALGLRFLFVPSSGADLKLTGNPHLPPTDEQVQHTQTQVDLLTDYFYSLVEEMRGIPQANIRALRGAALLATQGIDKGLVDVISDWDSFLAALSTATLEDISMAFQAKKAEDKEEKGPGPWEEALSALMAASEGEDEEKKAKAKKMLKALMSDDEPAEKPAAKKAEEPAKEPAAKAEEPPAEKKAEGGDYVPKAEGEEEARKAQARASSTELDLARRVHELEAERARDKENARRAELFSQRPDFSAEVRKSLAKASIEVLEDAVKSWPRVAATPMAAATAAQPAATPGASDSARPVLDSTEQAILAKFDAGRKLPTQARMVASQFVLDHMDAEAAAKRLEELKAQGVNPQGVPFDMSRIDNMIFRNKAGK